MIAALRRVEEQHGSQSVIYFDAGYNVVPHLGVSMSGHAEAGDLTTKLSATQIRDLPSEGIQELSDFQGTLKDLSTILAQLIVKYGFDAVLYTDAGFNNVEARVVPRQIIEAHERPKTARTPVEDPVKAMQRRKDITRLKNLIAKYGVPE
jgi:hypothetical protein